MEIITNTVDEPCCVTEICVGSNATYQPALANSNDSRNSLGTIQQDLPDYDYNSPVNTNPAALAVSVADSMDLLPICSTYMDKAAISVDAQNCVENREAGARLMIDVEDNEYIEDEMTNTIDREDNDMNDEIPRSNGYTLWGEYPSQPRNTIIPSHVDEEHGYSKIPSGADMDGLGWYCLSTC